MAGRPPNTDITSPSTIDEISATFGSTPDTNENEITSGINASAVTTPASVSRVNSRGDFMVSTMDGESSSAIWAVRSSIAVMSAPSFDLVRPAHDAAKADVTG